MWCCCCCFYCCCCCCCCCCCFKQIGSTMSCNVWTHITCLLVIVLIMCWCKFFLSALLVCMFDWQNVDDTDWGSKETKNWWRLFNSLNCYCCGQAFNCNCFFYLYFLGERKQTDTVFISLCCGKPFTTSDHYLNQFITVFHTNLALKVWHELWDIDPCLKRFKCRTGLALDCGGFWTTFVCLETLKTHTHHLGHLDQWKVCLILTAAEQRGWVVTTANVDMQPVPLCLEKFASW